MSDRRRKSLWSHHDQEWRDPREVIAFWPEASAIESDLLSYEVRGSWWAVLRSLDATILVTREYEHLVMGVAATDRGGSMSYLRLPHPSGLVADRQRGVVHIASTRNPNQVFEFKPVETFLERGDSEVRRSDRPLVPVASHFFPGSLYLHDLAIIGGRLHGNAVGHNAVVRLGPDGEFERVWWPRSIEGEAGPMFSRNHLQLNSIAAGKDLSSSFFSASADQVSRRRPGHRNFPVDQRGVIFSGKTREVIARGLTRPHSARLHRGRIWVDNSGYGELGYIDNDGLIATTKLPGWTRGLCFIGDVAFVGTSRVIPRFRQYAPGLDLSASRCGIHAVDVKSGKVMGSLIWPNGNQIFAIDWLSRTVSSGFPFSISSAGKRIDERRNRALFYAFQTGGKKPARRDLIRDASEPRKRRR